MVLSQLKRSILRPAFFANVINASVKGKFYVKSNKVTLRENRPNKEFFLAHIFLHSDSKFP